MMDFMDTLKRGVDRAGFELDRLLRANRVRSQINGLRSQVDEEVRQIGRHVFELYQQGEPLHEDLRKRCERIQEYQAEITEREAEVEAINNETSPPAWSEPPMPEPVISPNCPGCGSPTPRDAIYCPRCGRQLEQATQPKLSPQDDSGA